METTKIGNVTIISVNLVTNVVNMSPYCWQDSSLSASYKALWGTDSGLQCIIMHGRHSTMHNEAWRSVFNHTLCAFSTPCNLLTLQSFLDPGVLRLSSASSAHVSVFLHTLYSCWRALYVHLAHALLRKTSPRCTYTDDVPVETRMSLYVC